MVKVEPWDMNAVTKRMVCLKIIRITLCVCVIVCLQIGCGKTIYVSKGAKGERSGTSWEDAYTEIQEAIQNSEDFDEIWVASGRYEETLFVDRPVNLYGGFQGNEEQLEQRNWKIYETIIDSGSFTSSAIRMERIHSEEDDETLIDGFTVTGGKKSGIYCIESKPLILNCTFAENRGDDGGGIYGDQSTINLTNCVILNNRAKEGGGIYSKTSTYTMLDCTIAGNHSDNGGGIYATDSLINVYTSLIARNSAWNGAGGYSINSPIEFTKSYFILNVANHNGGAWFNQSSSSLLRLCIINENKASKGGGLFLNNTSLKVSNCLLASNQANAGGGIFAEEQSSNWMVNCTIAENRGGGLANTMNSYATISNSIFWNYGDEIVCEKPDMNQITYSCIQGGWPGEGNIDEHPCFADVERNDFHLYNDSPCIDSGIAESVWNDACRPPGLGLSRNDMGMYGGPSNCEYPSTLPTRIYVRNDIGQSGNGSTWNKAMKSLKEALESNWAKEIWVAKGRYKESIRIDGKQLYGGFKGDETTLTERDWRANETIIDSSGLNGRVVVLENESILNGVTITGGDNSGILCREGHTEIANCIIAENYSQEGGGVYCDYGSKARFVNCLIVNNKAMQGGGGFCFNQSRPTFLNCTIAQNEAMQGAGLYTPMATPNLINCIMWNIGQEIEGRGKVRYSCIKDYMQSENVIHAFPNFADMENRDYRLQNGSPCIDQGLIVEDIETDLDGNQRPGDDGYIDLGAYESPDNNFPEVKRPPERLFVCANAAPGGDGLRWDSALPSINIALSQLWEAGEIWVAEGIYQESVRMRLGVDLYGGFYGNEEHLEERDWINNRTIIDATGLDLPGVIGADDANLDGFVIENAKRSGVYCNNTSPTLKNCIITNNYSDTGGGVYCYRSEARFINCLITKNKCEQRVGGAGYCEMKNPIFIHCTIADNQSGFDCSYSEPILTNCILWNFRLETNVNQMQLSHCCVRGYDGKDDKIIKEYPWFIDPEHGNYKLEDGSPCIDQAILITIAQISLNGIFRPDKDMAADIGAFETPPEFQESSSSVPQRLYVRSDIIKPGDGSSWEKAFPTINSALRRVVQPCEIWVSGGFYSEYLQLDSDIQLLGGFNGTETSADQRDWQHKLSIIDASGLDQDVVACYGNVLLDGFVMRGGKNGIYCNTESAMIRHCVIEDNFGDSRCGLYCDQSSVTCSGCEIKNNSSTNSLAGVALLASDATFENCIIQNNQGSYGSGLYSNNSTSTIKNCIVSKNSSKNSWAGMYFIDSSLSSLENCTVSRNWVVDNNGRDGIVSEGTNVFVTNSIVWEDRLYSRNQADLEVTWSDVEEYIAGEGNINFDPQFMSGEDGDAANLYLRIDSPCIDAGNPDPVWNDGVCPPGLGTIRCDMGAYGGPGNNAWDRENIFGKIDNWFMQ